LKGWLEKERDRVSLSEHLPQSNKLVSRCIRETGPSPAKGVATDDSKDRLRYIMDGRVELNSGSETTAISDVYILQKIGHKSCFVTNYRVLGMVPDVDSNLKLR